jgi:hypothetical protein
MDISCVVDREHEYSLYLIPEFIYVSQLGIVLMGVATTVALIIAAVEI